MKTNKTENTKQLYVDIRIPELELIKLLNNCGYNIPPDYSLDSFHADRSTEELVIGLKDSSRLQEW